MWFLLVKIFFLLCLAALLGAALAWWWMRRHFVDVTETHEELSRQVEALQAPGKFLSREDIDSSLTLALASYRPPQPDLTPLHHKLIEVERMLAAPNQDLFALHDRLNGLEQSVSAISASLASVRSVHLEAIDQHLRGVSARIDNLRMPDIDGVNARLSSLATHIADSRTPDLRPAIEPRLDRIEAMLAQIRLPETNLGPVHSGLAALELAIENLELPQPDFAPLAQQMAGLRDRIDRLDGLKAEFSALSDAVKAREGDMEVVLQSVGGLEAAVRAVQIPEPDIAPILERLSRLESRLAAGPSPERLIGSLAGIESDLDVISRRQVDLGPVYDQLAALEENLSAMRTEIRGAGRIDALDRRVASLQDSILNLPQPDFERIDQAVRDIESRFNLGALEDRLTSIEYGLTAVHHMLRSRGDSPRTEFERRPVVRAERMAPPAVAEVAARPARRADPIARARRADDEANLLTHAAFGAGDDLEQIVGVGPMLAGLLHEVGVYYFWQIAEWTDADVAYVDSKLLHFRGRIERDDWVGQSRDLAALPSSAKRPASE